MAGFPRWIAAQYSTDQKKYRARRDGGTRISLLSVLVTFNELSGCSTVSLAKHYFAALLCGVPDVLGNALGAQPLGVFLRLLLVLEQRAVPEDAVGFTVNAAGSSMSHYDVGCHWTGFECRRFHSK